MALPSFQNVQRLCQAVLGASRQQLSLILLLLALLPGWADAAVEIEPNNTAQQANVLTMNVPMQGQLSSDSDQDWFLLSVSGATAVSIFFDSPMNLS